VKRRGKLLAVLVFLASCEPASVTGVGDPATDAVALRVVTLAPHLAELVFAVGAGEVLAGVSSFTDYPDAAALLPVVGDAFMIDREQLALLRPDVLLAWESGTPVHVVDELRAAGFRVEVIRTRNLDDVAAALLRIGELTGHRDEAEVQARAFRKGIAERKSRFVAAEPLRVFYQVSMRPLYTINAGHYISELIAVCGADNIFSDLGDLAPMVAVEAVIERDPEVLLAGGTGEGGIFDEWQRWPRLSANRYGNQFVLPPSELGRATPRLLQAADAMCEALQQARYNRKSLAAAH
jgi:iron complex transport system substrate-binding protein